MKRTLIFLLLGIFFIGMGMAHTPESQKKVVIIGEKQQLDSLEAYRILHHNAPEDFETPGVPSFAFVGKDGKFIMGVGGYAKAVIGWDIGNPIDSPDEFITSHIPVGPNDGNGSKFNLTAKQTHLYINFVALPGSGNEIGAFVSANLLNGYTPTVQFAYLKYRGVQAGYDYSLFSDPACGAPAVDYEGPCSSTANPVAGVSYTWEPFPHGRWELSLGLELPQVSFTTVDGKSAFVYQRVPDIPLAVRYSWANGNSWIRPSLIFRNITYRDLLNASNRNCFGCGAQISGAFAFLDKFTLYYQGVVGKGIGSMIQDTVDQSVDLVPSDDGKSLSPSLTWGGFASLQYDLCDKVCFSATYSHLRSYASPYAGGSTSWADLYKYTQYVSSNVFFHATSFISVGLEYIWGRRKNQDGASGTDNRLQAGVQLSF